MSDRSRAVRWLSRVYGSLLQRMRVREAHKRIQRRRPTMRGCELQELEPRLLLATTAANTTIGTFTGGDANEGLDLDGKFVYAVNVNGPAVGPIRDASFTSSASTPGSNLFASSLLSNFYTPNFGDSPNDNALETVMQSIAYSGSPNTVRVTLANLTSGVDYKLQLLMGGPSFNNRRFDIYANAGVKVKIVDDFNVTETQGGVTVPNRGTVVTYQFTASQSNLEFILDGSSPTVGDKTPILNGFTLEQLTPVVTLGATVNATEGFGYGSTIDGF
ncbi:MAG: hypothetical protein NT069_19500, partial [Planctomycetota bacterium]|nr:hypothetical protein [Planctomycetota bacterium]